ncbi:hypothetical protein GQ55_3G040800 [Panicum hallii var. hallii]|uniref:Uncharacterized protein n=1 Tax=Panicum hallii var. hallii TaxID=1504633 RepID=A0A2T7E5I7_9POAL|nr:hypothetical protein GQ55_3G040800 [Panicum hallii var. hallii]
MMKSTGFHVICLPQSDRSRVSLARFHFRFIPWSLVVTAGAALLGRRFAVLLQYQGYWTSRPALLFGLW